MSVAAKVNQLVDWVGSQSDSDYVFTRLASYSFVNMYNFLNTTCSVIGVVLRASNYGTSGAGFNYHDEGLLPHGDGAWAVFEFTNANPKFWVYIGVNYGGAVTAGHPSYPLTIDGSMYRGFVISYATREDGGSPWNGTMLANGTDTKGSPVWTAGASRLYSFPRSNNSGGSQTTLKQNCSTVIGKNTGTGISSEQNSSSKVGSYSHYFAGNDWLTVVHDPAALGVCTWSHFGQYLSSSNHTSRSPYFQAICNGKMSTNHGFVQGMTDEDWMGQVYGSLNGTNSDSTTYTGMPAYYDAGISQGGIACPNTSSASPVRSMMMSLGAGWQTYLNLARPNVAIADNCVYDEVSPHLYVFESPYNAVGLTGYVGVAKNLKFTVQGLPHNSTNSDKTKIAFHVLPQVASQYYDDWQSVLHLSMIMPWSPSYLPYDNATKNGNDFVIT